MGFLKRFFSMGSRKSKKRQQNHQHEPMPADAQGRLRAVEPWQSEANRLLRSSSAHFTVVAETDYSCLPPLPHSTNNLLSPAATPARSIASTVKRSGTYTVTVHGRTTHSRTEFPNANPPLHDDPEDEESHADLAFFDESPTKKSKPHPNPNAVPFTPRDKTRLHRLRQDPSVARLLNMFDDKGRIQSTAFSNTPPSSASVYEVEGKEQKKRTGSTLRQLLGEPDVSHFANCTAMEGDISWAERELARFDRSSMSFASETSLPLETPKDTHFDNHLSEPHVVTNTTVISDDSHSDTSANWPAISSLEVELSGTTSIISEHNAIFDAPAPTEQDMITKTPQRASEVFGFLTERRKSILERNRAAAEAQNLPPLPALSVPGLGRSLSTASAMSTPALTTATTTNSLNSSPAGSSDTSSAQIHHATLTKLTPMSRSTDTLNLLYTYAPLSPVNFTSNPVQSSKIPRGPRPLPPTKHAQSASQSALYPQGAVDVVTVPDVPPPASLPSRIPKSSSSSRAYDPYTPVHKRAHRRTTSRASSSMALSDNDSGDENIGSSVKPTSRTSRSRKPIDKENSPNSQPKSKSKTYPKTPAVRSHSRALFETRHPNLVNGDPPSPASSTELSPSDVRSWMT